MATDDEAPDDSGLPPTRELSWIPLVGAFAIVVVIIVLTVTLSSGENRGAPNAPRVDGRNALLCPGAYQFDPQKTWVPNQPIGVSVGTSLAPDESPDQVAVCRYAAPTGATASSLALQGRVVLGGDLDKVRSALVAAKVRSGNAGTSSASASASGAVYLIGLTYPDGTLWVSVGTSADGNGKVVTTDDLRSDTATAYTTKRWP